MNSFCKAAGFLTAIAVVVLFASTFSVHAIPPVIVIDPGHGGSSMAGTLKTRSNSSSNNTKSPSGLLEKDLTLEFSRILKQEILSQAGSQKQIIGVILTRNDDRNLDFIQRAAICDRADTACIISIHFNASSSHDAKGSVAMISAKKDNPNYAVDKTFGSGLAAACSNGVQKYLPSTKSRGTISDTHLHGGLGSNFFFQLATKKRLADVPKCFLEVEFIDNPEVDEALLKGSNRSKKFQHIAAGIAKYLLANI